MKTKQHQHKRHAPQHYDVIFSIQLHIFEPNVILVFNIAANTCHCRVPIVSSVTPISFFGPNIELMVFDTPLRHTIIMSCLLVPLPIFVYLQ